MPKIGQTKMHRNFFLAGLMIRIRRQLSMKFNLKLKTRKFVCPEARTNIVLQKRVLFRKTNLADKCAKTRRKSSKPWL